MSNKTLRIGLFIAIAAILLAGGWWVANQRAASMDAAMRGHMLRQVKEIAGGINPELVKKITFTASDKGTPAFEQLCEQMIAASKTFPHCGIYSMALREGKIVFGPETYKEDDPLASPPGTEYQQPSPADLQIFKDKRPVTIGPYKDEYGTFVSSLVPILDPHSNEVLMVVAVDILASDWQDRVNSVRRGPLLASLTLILLIAGLAVAVHFRNRNMKPAAMKLKKWIIAPTALAMLLALMAYGANEYEEIFIESNTEMLHITEQARSEWNQNIDSQVQLLKAQIDHIAIDAEMLNAWQERDISSLTAMARPAHEQLKRDYKITHYYFIAPDRTCFLRAHQPERRGDIIDRTTLLTAQRTGEDAWGVELGPLGTFTLRYVRPWKQDGLTIGYLELGMEIEHLVGQLAENTNLDLMTIIRKEFTTREKFEAGRQTFGFAGQWDAFPNFVIAHQIIANIPNELMRWLGQDFQSSVSVNEVTNIREGKKRFTCGVINLPDVAGRKVAHLVVMRDVTREIDEAQNTLLMHLGLAMVFACGIIVLLWSVTGAAERQLGNTFTQLQEREIQFRGLFENAISAVAVHEIILDDCGKPVDYTILKANSAFETQTGLRVASVLGKRITEILPGVQESSLIGIYGKVALTGEPIAFEQFVEPLQRHYNISAYQLSYGCFATVFQDITERKQAEKALIINKAKLDLSLQSSKMGVWEYNIVENKRMFDNQVCSLLGIDPAKFGGSAEEFFAVMHPEDRKKTKAALMMTIEWNVPYEVEYRVVWPDGRIHHISARGLLQHDVKGTPQMISGIIWDITERKQAEDESQIQRQRLANIIEGTNVGTWEWNVQTGETLFNERWAEIVGYTLEDIAPTSIETWLHLAHPDDLKNSELLLQKHFAGELDYYDCECRMKHKNGSWVWVHDRGRIIERNPDGKPLRISGTHADITERKRAEAAILETNHQLEIATARANEMAAQAGMANAAKSEFLANMSHEIRTPMNAIIGFTELLAEENPTAKQLEYTKIIHDAGSNLLTIINDILDFSKIESNKVNIEIVECDLGEIIGTLESMLRPLAKKKNLDFEILQCGPLPSKIKTDPTRVHQCLINLVNNAIKFTAKGHVYVNISTDESDGKTFLVFDVEDTGIGLEEDKLNIIFEPYQQADGSTTRKFGGTGLGLTITKKFVTLLGGSINVTSQLNVGSHFTIRIPAGTEQGSNNCFDKYDYVKHAGTSATKENVKYSGRILVAEDNPSNQALISILLKKLGLGVVIAEDGYLTVEKAIAEKFDLIFMDMQMPRMSGLDATRLLREKGLTVPIVALTANALKGTESQCLEAGCDSFLTKPIDRMLLLETIEKHLSQTSDMCETSMNTLPECSADSDIDHLVSELAGDPDLGAVIEIFVGTLPELLAQIRLAHDHSDHKTLKSHIHTLKGASASAGFAPLARKALEIEQSIKENDLEAITIAVAQLYKLCGKIKTGATAIN